MSAENGHILGRCPNCGKYLNTEEGYGDTAERGANPEFTPIAAFCDEACARIFHGRATHRTLKQERAALKAGAL